VEREQDSKPFQGAQFEFSELYLPSKLVQTLDER